MVRASASCFCPGGFTVSGQIGRGVYNVSVNKTSARQSEAVGLCLGFI